MQVDAASLQPALIEPLPYHTAIRDFLKQTDSDVWRWFSSQRRSAKLAEEVRFDLLKSTYRVDRELQPSLYDAADDVKRRLGIAPPLTIYQAQNPEGLNASLAYVPDEIHLIFHGPIAAQLNAEELRALIAHELAHFRLWESGDGELLVASDVLHALVTDPHAHPAHFASWRLFRLYMEIYCDRTALAVTGDLLPVVSMLVKVHTGVGEVSAESFLRQATEIFARGDAKTEGLTHPEAYIRARALQLWSEQHPVREQLTSTMIAGHPSMDEVDLLEQRHMADATRRVVDLLLWRKWFQTDAAVAHARLFFDDYQAPADPVSDPALGEQFRSASESVRDYYCYLLLDFVTADRDLEEAPLAAALVLAELIEIKPRFLELARKELKLRKNQLEKIDRNREQILAEADRVTEIS